MLVTRMTKNAVFGINQGCWRANAVSLKLLQFWSTGPQIWFAQAEAQFALRKIVSDDTKYYYIFSALDQTTASQLKDLISHPPDKYKYDALKDKLLNTFELSKPERASLLLHFRPLSNTKPSALMDEMLALLEDYPPCFLFQQLFLESLPEDIWSQLIDEEIRDHRRLARKANKIWASRQMRSYANNVQMQPTPSSEQVPYKAPDEI